MVCEWGCMGGMQAGGCGNVRVELSGGWLQVQAAGRRSLVGLPFRLPACRWHVAPGVRGSPPVTQTASWPGGVSAGAKMNLEEEESEKIEDAATKVVEPPPTPPTPADGADAAADTSTGQAGGVEEEEETLTPEELAAAVVEAEAGGEHGKTAESGGEAAAAVGVVVAGEEEGGELDAEEYKAAMEEATQEGAALEGAGEEEATSAGGHGKGWGKSGEELAKEMMDAARKKAEDERQAKRVMEQWVPGAKKDEEVTALEAAEEAAIEIDAAAAAVEAEVESSTNFFVTMRILTMAPLLPLGALVVWMALRLRRRRRRRQQQWHLPQ